MKTRTDISRVDVLTHFTNRAATYDDSSKWCTDRELLEKIYLLLSPTIYDRILDLACGTGLVSKTLKSRVGMIVGLDLTEAMFIKGLTGNDCLIQAQAEQLPIKNRIFDISLERQGIQFMDALAAVREMVRVTKPGGKICLTQLCAYDHSDMEEYFEILRLRNPARRNFFLKADLERLLISAGCSGVKLYDHISVEDVDRWADNGAIGQANRQRIRDLYRSASSAFKRFHAVSFAEDGKIIDNMLFCIAIGIIP